MLTKALQGSGSQEFVDFLYELRNCIFLVAIGFIASKPGRRLEELRTLGCPDLRTPLRWPYSTDPLAWITFIHRRLSGVAIHPGAPAWAEQRVTEGLDRVSSLPAYLVMGETHLVYWDATKTEPLSVPAWFAEWAGVRETAAQVAAWSGVPAEGPTQANPPPCRRYPRGRERDGCSSAGCQRRAPPSPPQKRDPQRWRPPGGVKRELRGERCKPP